MRIGAIFPQTEIGSDPGGVKDYAQAAEAMGRLRSSFAIRSFTGLPMAYVRFFVSISKGNPFVPIAPPDYAATSTVTDGVRVADRQIRLT